MTLTEMAASLDATNALTGQAEHDEFERGAEDMERRARRIEAEREADAEVAIDAAEVAAAIAEPAPSAHAVRAARLHACVDAIDRPEHARNAFAHDVVAKYRRFHMLTDRQLDALEASLARDRAFAARNTEPKGDAPEGKATITGEVVSTKWHESTYGGSLKMTIKIENGARAWMTVPSGYGINKGDRLTVSATFTRSETDRSFAFGKRPRVVEHVPATVAA